MNQKTKLKICLIANLLLLIIVTLLMFQFNAEDKYCRLGPPDDLIILSLHKYYEMELYHMLK
jgi:hypothetical protein